MKTGESHATLILTLKICTGMRLYTRRDKDVRTNSGICFSHANPIQQRVKCYLIIRKRKKEEDVERKEHVSDLCFSWVA